MNRRLKIINLKNILQCPKKKLQLIVTFQQLKLLIFSFLILMLLFCVLIDFLIPKQSFQNVVSQILKKENYPEILK